MPRFSFVFPLMSANFKSYFRLSLISVLLTKTVFMSTQLLHYGQQAGKTSICQSRYVRLLRQCISVQKEKKKYIKQGAKYFSFWNSPQAGPVCLFCNKPMTKKTSPQLGSMNSRIRSIALHKVYLCIYARYENSTQQCTAIAPPSF